MIVWNLWQSWAVRSAALLPLATALACSSEGNSDWSPGLEVGPSWKLLNLACNGEVELLGESDQGLFDQGRIGPAAAYSVNLNVEGTMYLTKIAVVSVADEGERTIGSMCGDVAQDVPVWYAIMPEDSD